MTRVVPSGAGCIGCLLPLLAIAAGDEADYIETKALLRKRAVVVEYVSDDGSIETYVDLSPLDEFLMPDDDAEVEAVEEEVAEDDPIEETQEEMVDEEFVETEIVEEEFPVDLVGRLRALKNLTRLTVDSDFSDACFAELPGLDKLTRLNVRTGKPLSSVSLRALRELPRLRDLRLSDLSKPSADILCEVALLTQLTSISLDLTEYGQERRAFSGEELRLVGKLPQVRSIQLQGPLPDDGLTGLSGATALRELVLTDYSESPIRLQGLAQLKGLETLRLRGVLPGESEMDMIASLPRLAILDLSTDPELMSPGLLGRLGQSASLKRLVLHVVRTSPQTEKLERARTDLRIVRKGLPYDPFAALNAPTVTAFRIKYRTFEEMSRKQDRDDPETRYFQGSPILEQRNMDSKELVAELCSILNDPETYDPTNGAFCYEPGFAVRFVHGLQTVDVMICLMCQYTHIGPQGLDRREKIGGFITEVARDKLLKIYEQLFGPVKDDDLKDL